MYYLNQEWRTLKRLGVALDVLLIVAKDYCKIYDMDRVDIKPKKIRIKMTNLIEKIQEWVSDRNLNTQDPRVQMCKTMEEMGELANAINKGNKADAMDGIGDVVVTLICVSMQLNVDFNECLKNRLQ